MDADTTKLKQYAEDKGIKFAWLAEKTGIKYQRILRIRDGLPPFLAEARAICDVLGVTEEEIFDVQVSGTGN